jgi:hypothetical protein
MNKNRLNGAAKTADSAHNAAGLLARLTSMFVKGGEIDRTLQQPLSQHTMPTLDSGRWVVTHSGPNYATRRHWALVNRTRDRLGNLSEPQLAPTANRPYRKARPGDAR